MIKMISLGDGIFTAVAISGSVGQVSCTPSPSPRFDFDPGSRLIRRVGYSNYKTLTAGY